MANDLPITLPPDRKKELTRLLREFRTTYLPSDAAQEYLNALVDARSMAAANFQTILTEFDAGHAPTDEVLHQLLPHADTAANRWRGAWLHPVAAIVGDLRTWYEAAGWTASDAWPAIATALVGFVRQAIESPSQLADACAMWAALPYTTGFQSGLLTPILNALRPDDFLILHNQNRNLLNYAAGTRYTQSIGEYPAANQQLFALLQTLAHLDRRAFSAKGQCGDYGLLFAHWLTTEKRFTLRAGRYWALDVGTDPWVWQEWCDGNMIAIGGPSAWDELGDLTAVTRHDFYQRRDSLLAQHNLTVQGIPTAKRWTKRSAEPLWRFARQMQEGDTVVVYHDKYILGIGTICGPYYFTADVPLGHRRPVEWQDLTTRTHGTAFVSEPLVAIDAPLFTALAESPSTEDGTNTSLPHAHATTHREATATEKTQPEFVRYVAPVLETLQAMGGQGRAGEVMDAIRDQHKAHDEASTASPTRTNRLRRHLYRARHYLLRAGLLTTEQHGIWQLTARGRNTSLADGDAQKLYEDIEYQQQLSASYVGASEQVRRLAEASTIYTIEPAEPTPSHAAPPPSSTAIPIAEPYSLQQVAAATFLEQEELARWIQAIERKGQAIFYGPPGVGKTFVAEQLARHLAGERVGTNTDTEHTGDTEATAGASGIIETVQFHAAYAYEDFVQGMRPQTNANGQLIYPIVPGRFLTFCTEAAKRSGRCTLIIDEINRADLARVFGELMYLLEYRDRTVRLAADGRPFAIPANVRIIGTMNTADRSIALVDHALRRRFAFIALQPDWSVLQRYHEHHQTAYPVEQLIQLLQRINRQIGDPQYAIGHSFFMTTDLSATVMDIWQLEIEPYLEEIFFDQPDAVDRLRWARVQHEIKGAM